MGNLYGKLIGEENHRVEQRFSDLMTPVKRLRYLVDPRSATRGIERSPIVVQEEPVYQQTPVKVKQEMQEVAEVEKCEIAVDAVPEDEIDEAIIIFEDMAIEEPRVEEPQVEEPPELIEVPKLIETPKLKKQMRRPPLGKICTNSPVSDLTPHEDKTWMNFKDERVRRGIEGVENTPPFLLKAPDQIQSAPGKFTRRQPLSLVPQMVVFED